MAVRVKICGITDLEDALGALAAGADALGFIFYRKSPRFISFQNAREIISKLPPFVSKVGVFVDENLQTIQEVSDQTGIDTIQLHGSEPPEFCEGLRWPVIKAVRVRNEGSLKQLERYRVSAFLLDSYVPGQPGGTGEKFNWELAIQAKRANRPVILAGGLTPLNIREAVSAVRPFAVDVSSGVESAPGKKDLQKVREFILQAKAA
jgi:phosphoribosylanthranilate isomerase